jgi:hypothetical protein
VPLVPNEIAATKPADAGTPSKTISRSRVDCAAIVGSPGRQLKTRFPTAMRLSKEMRAYALAAGFEPEKIQRMFEQFRDFNISQRTYSRAPQSLFRTKSTVRGGSMIKRSRLNGPRSIREDSHGQKHMVRLI